MKPLTDKVAVVTGVSKRIAVGIAMAAVFQPSDDSSYIAGIDLSVDVGVAQICIPHRRSAAPLIFAIAMLVLSWY